MVYYLWLMPNGYDSNEWTHNSWMTLWIGHVATWGAAALFWPLSYIGGPLVKVYGWVWGWADALGSAVMLTIVTMHLIAGIMMPSDKTVWETLVVYFVVEAVMGMGVMSMAEAAKMYYMWGEWEEFSEEAKEWCAKDAEGNCIECEEGDEDCIYGLKLANLMWSTTGF